MLYKVMGWFHKMRPLPVLTHVVLTAVLIWALIVLIQMPVILPIHILLGVVLGVILGALTVSNVVLGVGMFLYYCQFNTIWEDKND